MLIVTGIVWLWPRGRWLTAGKHIRFLNHWTLYVTPADPEK